MGFGLQESGRYLPSLLHILTLGLGADRCIVGCESVLGTVAQGLLLAGIFIYKRQ